MGIEPLITTGVIAAALVPILISTLRYAREAKENRTATDRQLARVADKVASMAAELERSARSYSDTMNRMAKADTGLLPTPAAHAERHEPTSSQLDIIEAWRSRLLSAAPPAPELVASAWRRQAGSDEFAVPIADQVPAAYPLPAFAYGNIEIGYWRTVAAAGVGAVDARRLMRTAHTSGYGVKRRRSVAKF